MTTMMMVMRFKIHKIH